MNLMFNPLDRLSTRHGTAYREVGSGEPLVLIHGVGMRLEAWEPQLAALSSSHRVIAVDMPGHGRSDRLVRGASLPDFVAWLETFLDDLALSSTNVAGHSMGAMIAGGAAASFGPRISRVALLNGVYRRDKNAAVAVRDRAERIAGGDPIDFDGPLRRWFGEGREHETVYRLTRSWLCDVDAEGYAVAYTAFAQGDATYADDWPDMTCPALFLTGRDDPNSTPAMANAMAAAAPRGTAVVIDGRHMVNLTAPDRVNAILSQWLREEIAE